MKSDAEEPVDRSRRRLFLGQRDLPFRPPWLSEEAIRDCTGCGDCTRACPHSLLSLVFDRPEIALSGGECTFCGACAEACPEGIFDRRRPAFSHTVVIGDGCLPFEGVVCQSCRDACPESAIRFQPRRGGPFLPDIRVSACTGCGACIAPCPTSAIRLAHREPADA
ncbi:MAG TPA: ferredoxin-type protein NapF [Methylomirabilota bacterium]|nr:ferredoxin-type protein NapF [Methylomirabilota bacterium]